MRYLNKPSEWYIFLPEPSNRSTSSAHDHEKENCRRGSNSIKRTYISNEKQTNKQTALEDLKNRAKQNQVYKKEPPLLGSVLTPAFKDVS